MGGNRLNSFRRMEKKWLKKLNLWIKQTYRVNLIRCLREERLGELT